MKRRELDILNQKRRQITQTGVEAAETDFDNACEIRRTALKSSDHYELNELFSCYFIWPLLPDDIHLSSPHLSLSLSAHLKVTLLVCQSPAMTPDQSVIHHVSCVSTRCCTSWAVGGLSGPFALYDMQITLCKFTARPWRYICAYANVVGF